MRTRSTKRSSESPEEKRETATASNIKVKRRKLSTCKVNAPLTIPVKNESKRETIVKNEDSSSESSSDDYMIPINEINLDSEYFKIEKKEPMVDFSTIENNILEGIAKLSESEDSDFDEVAIKVENTKVVSSSSSTIANKNGKGSETKAVKNEKSKNLDKRDKNKISSKRSSLKPNSKITIKEERNEEKPRVDMMDVSQLLALGETSHTSEYLKFSESLAKSKDSSCSEDERTDWEEVDVEETTPEMHSIPKEGVQITLEMPELYHKHKKRGFDMEGHMRRHLNRVKREIQVLVHKVHLLCWISHCLHINKLLNSEVLMGISLSIIPSQHCYPPKHADLDYLEQFVKWFNKSISETKDEMEKESILPLNESLLQQLQSRTANSKRDLVLIFICVLRSLGLQARLVLSLQPLPLKPHSSELCTIAAKNPTTNKHCAATKSNDKQSSSKPSDSKTNKKDLQKNKTNKSQNNKTSNATEKSSGKSTKDKKSNVGKQPSNKTNYNKQSLTKGEAQSESTSPSKSSLRQSKSLGKSKKDETVLGDTIKTLRSKSDLAKRYKCSSSSSEKESNSSQKGIDTQPKTSQTRISTRNSKSTKKSSKTSKVLVADSDDDSDFEPGSKKVGESDDEGSSSDDDEDFKPKKPTVRGTGSTAARKGKSGKKARESDDGGSSSSDGEEFKPKKGMARKAGSSASPGQARTVAKKKEGINIWAEVFVEAEEKWISVDVPRGKIHCISDLHNRATLPVCYVLALSNDQTLKDVTLRYCPHFHTTTRKLRVDAEWWKATLAPFLGPRNARDREEDEDLGQQLMDRPLPSSISEYKNHPLYALKRHLLKFEAFYPPDTPSLGFVRSEAVYARDAVATLHSREVWIKEAKVVKIGEKPYKIVKARPKYDKFSGQFIKDLPLEVFGRWQVQDYVPPPAVDGKVPRNEYGNVELFKSCMLPKGTVHLRLAGLNRVARKLTIDCVPAVTGFDFHSGGNYPTFDGYIVCEEFKETLVDAWNQEQDLAEKRHLEKHEKRVYGNWRRLIKGLLIRKRLKERYAFGDVPGPSKSKKGKLGL